MPHDRFPRALTSLRQGAATLILAIGALSCLCACVEGDQPVRKVAGGTGSEAGDAYGVAWSVLGEKAAAAARVSLYVNNDTTYAHPTLHSETQADANGAFRFRSFQEGHYDLEIRSAGEDAILYKRNVFLRASGDTDLGRLSLPAAARFRGKLSAPATGSTRIWLDGTPYSAAVDSLGGYAFAPLPAGLYRIFSERLSGETIVRIDLGALTLNPGDSVIPPATDPSKPDSIPVVPPLDTVPALQMDSVVIENFDDGGEISTYGRTHGSGRWTATAEGGMPMYPTTGTFDAFTTITNGGAGKSLQVAYQPDQTSLKAIVELDMGLKDMVGPAPDSITFWAKGRGRLQMDALLWVPLTVTSAGARGGNFWVILTAEWKQYRFALLDLPVARQSGYLRFSGSQGESFFLDEILYKGPKAPAPKPGGTTGGGG